MPIISMVGCNAIGKSTAARRYAARYGRLGLVVVSADTQLVIDGGKERREREWKGTSAEKASLVQRYSALDRVVLVESARTTHLEFADPADPVLVVTCGWQLYRRHMKARCDAKGKRFRDDYWTEWKLGYESSRRYLNYADKKLSDRPVHRFEVTSQSEDWPLIDEQFGKLFRRLHNQLLRKT